MCPWKQPVTQGAPSKQSNPREGVFPMVITQSARLLWQCLPGPLWFISSSWFFSYLCLEAFLHNCQSLSHHHGNPRIPYTTSVECRLSKREDEIPHCMLPALHQPWPSCDYKGSFQVRVGGNFHLTFKKSSRFLFFCFWFCLVGTGDWTYCFENSWQTLCHWTILLNLSCIRMHTHTHTHISIGNYVYICVCTQLCLGVCQSQKMAIDPPELELQVFGNYLKWMLGRKLGFSARVAAPESFIQSLYFVFWVQDSLYPSGCLAF